jgi:hypothetical protein
MRTFDELERLWSAAGPPPAGRGSVRLIVLRTGGGAHQETSAGELSPQHGLCGDRWGAGFSPDPECQVTLMMITVAELLTAGELPLHLPGDNLLVDVDLSEAALPVGSRISVGEAVLEVSAVPHTGCKKFSQRFGQEALRWVNWKAHRSRRLRGANCRVIQGGRVAVGDPVRLLAVPR